MPEPNEDLDRTSSVLLQVCLNCGKEYYYESEPLPTDPVCERCGGEVFRSFDATADPDEVQQDFLDATVRDTLPEDPGTDITPGDLHDLNNP